MKMFEYMSCGVPIISSDLPVIREVLINKHNSLLVDPESISEWSHALKSITESSELEEKIGMNAYKDFKEKYTWNKRAESFLDLFDDFER